MSEGTARPARRGGYSYAEVLVATLLVAVSLVSALEALQTGVLAAAAHENEATLHYHGLAKLEEVLAQPFVDLENEAAASGGAPTSYSDLVGPDRRLVFLSPYGVDPGLVLVRVEIENTAHVFETLTSP